MKTRVRSLSLSALVIAGGWFSGHAVSQLLFPEAPEPVGAVSATVQRLRGESGMAGTSTSRQAPVKKTPFEVLKQPAAEDTNPMLARAASMADWLAELRTSEDFENALPLLSPELIADNRGTNKPLPVGQTFFRCWLAIDRPAALRAVARLAQGRFRDGFISSAMYQWVHTDGPGALEFVLSNHGPVKANAASSVVSSLTQKDPAKTLELLRQYGAERWLVDDAIWTWAGKSPQEALQWCMQQPSNQDTLKMLSSAFASYGREEHMHEALDLAVREVKDPAWRGEVLKSLLLSGGTESITPAERMNLVLQFSEGTVQKEILERLQLPGGEILNCDQAIFALAESLPDDAARTAYLRGQVKQLLFSLPHGSREIVSLAAAIPDDADRRETFGALGVAWAKAPEAAKEWLSAEPPSADRDAVAAAFAPSLLRTDPKAAMDYTAGIADETLRHSGLQNQYSGWSGIDPAAANQWLQNSRLTDAEKRMLAAASFSTSGPLSPPSPAKEK